MVKETFDMEENQCYGSAGVAPQKKEVIDSGSNRNVTVALTAQCWLLLYIAACCIAFALEISILKSETASAEQEQSISTIADKFEALNSSVDLLNQQVSDQQSQNQQNKRNVWG